MTWGRSLWEILNNGSLSPTGDRAVSIDQIDNANGRIWATDQNDFIDIQVVGSATTSNVTTSNTSFDTLTRISDGFELASIPPAATAYARQVADMNIDDGAETFTIRVGTIDTARNFVGLSEVDLSTSSTSSTIVDSGWTEITSISADDVYLMDDLKGKVSAGTATGTVNVGRHAVLIGWRL